ncbi:neutral/alkaline non-lysosomal ceramidase N-terminal domain-containing protein [Chryseosolibacter indicus]|uniref:Neutral/alkaline non-lysosomal ceramidase N-terminal domain-containing protein n=1 Tax=Chryseosolibacter indicus TaxID=2782351 RepID=A0ABS5VT43_9BACT|nr:neutral/alkaline non-lysosomal ceramidase N-terminal domain-containing protein [Chryseosolibacter indicus]MBT1703987.1 neutral/alkaline non-lysosomal ceramidase N-terminal domain-containing protein [Chryseosolibacter indicus]
MKVLKKVFKVLLITLLSILVAVILLAVFSIAPVNRTEANQDPSYDLMLQRLDSLKKEFRTTSARHQLHVGYSKVNITPSTPMSTAGYGKRKLARFNAVLDSIYIRTLVIDNGSQRVAIVSADLLILPPTVTAILPAKLKPLGFSLNNTYLGAIHSHNSIGHWGKGATQFIYGKYDNDVVEMLAEQIAESIRRASSNMLPSTFYVNKIAIPEAVDNRLIKDGKTDPYLRAVEIHRSDSSKLLFLSYTAHATCLFSRDLELSRDYPGALVDKFERNGYKFTMFMAGAVASHRANPPKFGEVCIEWMADQLQAKYMESRDKLTEVHDSTIAMIHLPITLGEPQVKITPELKVRAWLFRRAFGEYPAFINVLKLGDLVLLGTPCDYSGEFNPRLDSLGQQLSKNVIVTSFNGGYIGYLTPEQYYDVDHYETQLMNWYPPGTGEYLTECLSRLLSIVSNSN